ncbi:serine/threonine protein kinase [Arthrobacter zhangbolii]|uniref:Serine/threonine protein kinase n=1 Tax=Arthrobacter zhangbolii TaxID=2886936 RepID=A0A9X1M9A4_9MICC|nr:serine/threonine-protein kinase [Arthrobacter zhangbolii]MCC3273621.1 serine/threonine protein kinase [Arthrobacter zhangbolii]UON92426.1 serine/threonine protein kinase [Arthrobacter zhangbolii]
MAGAGAASTAISRSLPAEKGQTDSSGFSAHVLFDGRYCLDEPIGRGAAAYVWQATDLASLSKVAVKIFSAPLGHSPEGHEASREAAALAAVSSDHVLQLVAHGAISHPETGVQTPYLVMDLVPGENLRRTVARFGPYSPSAAADLGRQLAEGLSAVHTAGYIHRDIKPSNILLDPGSGTAKIADLGTAVDAQGGGEQQSYGSLPYMSPEQVHGTDLTGATDVYSLGLVLLESITGVRAFDLPQVESMVVRTVRGPQISAGLPAGWIQLLTAMTALEPTDRPTANQCRQAFVALAADHSGSRAA